MFVFLRFFRAHYAYELLVGYIFHLFVRDLMFMDKLDAIGAFDHVANSLASLTNSFANEMSHPFCTWDSGAAVNS